MKAKHLLTVTEAHVVRQLYDEISHNEISVDDIALRFAAEFEEEDYVEDISSIYVSDKYLITFDSYEDILDIYILETEPQLIENENGAELCYCTACGCYLIDNNPQADAKKYDTDIAEGELKQFEEPADDASPDDVEYFWGCPHCETDDNLMDV